MGGGSQGEGVNAERVLPGRRVLIALFSVLIVLPFVPDLPTFFYLHVTLTLLLRLCSKLSRVVSWIDFIVFFGDKDHAGPGSASHGRLRNKPYYESDLLPPILLRL